MIRWSILSIEAGQAAGRVEPQHDRRRVSLFGAVDAAVDVALHDGVDGPVGCEHVDGARWCVRRARAGESDGRKRTRLKRATPNRIARNRRAGEGSVHRCTCNDTRVT